MNVKRTSRVAIALAVAAVVTLIGTQTAAAVSGSITNYTTPVEVRFEGGATAGAALFTLTTSDADVLLAYCIDLNTHTGTGVTYDEGSWTQANVPDVAKVTAILQASYPVRTLAQLREVSGIATLTTQAAIAGTQAAIWHFTDLVNLDRDAPAQGANSNIGKLYDYLLGVASNPVVEPEPALSISPSTISATVGDRVGPFTLDVTPSTATITVSNDAGVAFTDVDGNPIVPNADGQSFWVTPTAEGTFQISATAEVAVPTGRVFLHTATEADPRTHQKLVLAKSGAVTTTATASFESTPTTTTTTTTTTEVPTTTAAPTTTTPAAPQDSVVAALPPVPPTPLAATPATTVLPTVLVLPATGSSSTLPGVLIAAGTLMLGIVITSLTRRRRTLS